jgi:hypothetical protein
MTSNDPEKQQNPNAFVFALIWLPPVVIEMVAGFFRTESGHQRQPFPLFEEEDNCQKKLWTRGYGMLPRN